MDRRIPYKDDSMWYWNQTDEVIVGFGCEQYWIDILPRGNIRIETPDMNLCGMGCSGDCDGSGEMRGMRDDCEMNHFCFDAESGKVSGGKLTAGLILGPYVKERNRFDTEVIDLDRAQTATEFSQFGRFLEPKNLLTEAVEAAVVEMARLSGDV